jgi:hypothetical protein
MKRILFLFTAVMFLLSASAQTRKSLYLKASDNTLFNYGRNAVMTTTDSSNHAIDSILIASGEAGMVEVQVVGYNDSLTKSVTGSYIARYNKTSGGTLTLGTPTAVSAVVTDTELGTATWSIVSSGNNIVVRIKGKLTYTVVWIANIRRIYRKTG